jgi:hypothetical protein
MARGANPWTMGTTYPPGSVVQPTHVNGYSSNPPLNPDFESGFTNWTADAGWSISTAQMYSGTQSAMLATGNSNKALLNTLQVVVTPGQMINASAVVNFTAVGAATMAVTLTWYNSGGGVISTSVGAAANGALLTRGSPGWTGINVFGQAPTTAVKVAIGCIGSNTSGHSIYVDYFDWDYLQVPFLAPSLWFAQQADTGKSGSIEPDWLSVPVGGTINDNTVTWSAQIPTAITWVCRALMTSGSGEPVWPTVQGQVKHDGSFNGGVDWIAVTPQVVDPKNPLLPPQSKFVFAAASKIFMLDGDIAPFSATTNPLDWSSEANAGFLPIGLRAFGTNPFLAAGIYRSNAVFMNSEGLQMWQLDEDPANMALLDALPVGCSQHRSIASVNDDMLFLSSQGVRSMGISAGSGNLQSGDVGMPLDPLVQVAQAWAIANNVEPIGGYFPALGQYFLAFPGWPADNQFWSSGGTCPATSHVGNAYTAVIPGATLRYGAFYTITFNFTATGAASLVINDGTNDLAPPHAIGPFANITAGSTWAVVYDPNLMSFSLTEITRLFVYTMGRTGEVGSWSHYAVQFTIENFCLAGDGVYMRGTRAGVPQVWQFDPTALIDTISTGNLQTYSVVQWPWLDDGQPGVTKQLSGIDMAVTMQNAIAYSVEIGYDQTDKNAFTSPYFQMATDTIPGLMYPFQVKAPSFSLRAVFQNDSGWSLQVADLYLTDKRLTS